eukprot:7088400-Pyramimonas_sp.AAC.1
MSTSSETPLAAHSAATASLQAPKAGPCGVWGGARSMTRMTRRELCSCGARRCATWRNSTNAQNI